MNNETVQMIITLLGGLALFIFGMNFMSDGLQRSAGDKMRNILAMLTRNPVMGALAGALVTAVLQSSSATTVMVIGFVSAGLMKLPPMMLVTPSGPAVDARFCRTAIVAELLCTTTVMHVPSSTPSTGISCTCIIRSTNTCELQSVQYHMVPAAYRRSCKGRYQDRSGQRAGQTAVGPCIS